jgi:mannose-6-phosphate isomerase-like protein (cupin superfamily)
MDAPVSAGGTTAHLLIRREEVELGPALPEHSQGLTRAVLIGAHTGATHMGLTLVELEAGHVDTHLHSFESSFFVLEGEPCLYLAGRGVRLRPNACGAIPVGVPHAWTSDDHSRWIEMAAPRPRPPDQPADTFFVGGAPDGAVEELDLRDPGRR